MRSGILLVLSVAASACAFGWLQGRTDRLLDFDSYYHARYAQVLPERGLSREFPWMQESMWRDRFSDKELLFHAWLAPFCRGEDVRGGAKLATDLLDLALVCVIAWTLAANGMRAPWAWVLLVPALGNHFVSRMLEVRAQVLSVVLFVLGVHCLLRARWRALVVLGFVYSWSYAAPHVLIAFALIDAAVRSIEARRLEWRGVAGSTIGVAAGLVVHPYFPNDLAMWWVQNVRVLWAAWGGGAVSAVRLGGEFGPVTTREFLSTATLVFACFAGCFLGAALRGGRLGLRSKLLLSYLLGGFLMYCLSAKLVEYFAPLALLSAASVASDLWIEGGAAWRRALAIELCIVLGGACLWKSMGDTHRAVTTFPSPELEGAARWAREHVPEGETIAHLDWKDFDELFYFDTRHHYLEGLDPMFMYVRSPGKLQMLEEMRAGKRPIDGKAIASAFSARYLIVGRDQVRRADEALLDLLYEDPGGAVFQLPQ